MQKWCVLHLEMIPAQGFIPSQMDDINTDKSHDNSHHGSFCVIGKDLECFELDDLY